MPFVNPLAPLVIYVNDQPLVYFENKDIAGDVALNLWAGGSTTEVGVTEVAFDNVKFWDLSRVPGLPKVQP